MSQNDYGIDNEGSGFGFDDDADIDDLLAMAGAGEEDADDEYSHLLMNKNFSHDEREQKEEDSQKDTSYEPESAKLNVEEVPVSEHKEQQTEPSTEEFKPVYEDYSETTYDSQDMNENVYDNSDNYEPITFIDEETEHVETQDYDASTENNISEIEETYENNYQKVDEPSTKVDEPSTKVPEHDENIVEEHTHTEPEPILNTQKVHRMDIRTEAQDIQQAKTIINVLDTYRRLQNSSKSVVAQFIYNTNEVDISDEAAIVIRVMNMDSMFNTVMGALKDAASETDRLERVFYILKLDQNTLFKLGERVESITGEALSEKNDKIAYAKELERSINNLDANVIQYVTDTQTLLASAQNSD